MVKKGKLKEVTFLTGSLLLILGIALALMPGTVCAQEQEGEYVLEDIVVTATKVGETSLQETPMAITVISGEFLDNTNVTSLDDLTLYVPSAQIPVAEGGRPFLYIRGIGSGMTSKGAEGAVGVYMDGVFLSRGWAGKTRFYDLERIEVLRGPQGTLYGRGSAGGAINIITKGPSDELELVIGAQIGNYSLGQVDATISGPIVEDKLKGRFTFSTSQHDGYLHNTEGPDIFDDDFTGWRGAVEWTPTDKIDIMFRGDYYSEHNRNHSNKLLSAVGAPSAIALASGIPLSTILPDDFWTVAQAGTDPYLMKRFWGLSATAEIKLPYNQLLRSITSYRKSEFAWDQDTDGTPIDLFVARSFIDPDTAFSQELQLNGSSERWNWILGLYYFHEVEDIVDLMDFFIMMPGLQMQTKFKYYVDAGAVFGNFTYALTDKLFFEGGLRYSYEEGEVEVNDSTTNIPFPPFNFSYPPDSRSWDDITARLGLNYKPTDDMLLYATFSQGFKSGMYAWMNPGLEKWLEPENIMAYEIGLKTDWFDKRLRANGAVFYYDYTDKHVNSYAQEQGIQMTTNAAEGTIKGAELEFTARPVEPLTLNAGITYLDTEYEEFLAPDPLNPTAFIDVSGNRMEYSPEWKVAAGAQYVFPVGDYGFLTFRGDISWTDDQFFTAYQNPFEGAEAYAVMDGLVRFETPDGHWSFELWGKNLGEEEYLTSAMNFVGDKMGWVGAPRTFGLQAIYRY